MNDLITRKDYNKRIDNEILEELLLHDQLNKEEVLTDEEAIAFSIIDCHLQERYETDGLFNPQLHKRNIPTAEWVVSIVLHQLYCNRKKPVPNPVVLNYVTTMKELEDIRCGRLNIDLPSKDTSFLNWDANEPGLDDDPDFESSMYWGI